MQLATLDPKTAEVSLFSNGGFERYDRPIDQLPTVKSSLAWYRGQRDHLGFAAIVPQAGAER